MPESRETWGRRRPGARRTLLVVVALLLFQLGSLIGPAYACGCGAMVTQGRTTMGVERETSVVRWDGRTEQIVMSFTVDGNAPEAAWIMPVPHRATVELGDRALFEELGSLTAPVYRTRNYFWPRASDWPFADDDRDGAGAPAPGRADAGVGVVGRQRLGDFEVARLTASDPDALRDWLKENGFELPDGLAREVRPYVERNWEYVAVRLAPEENGGVLRGDLDPLRLSFASERLVYPMRLSRLAATPQSLGLYVLAAHRMEPRDTIGGDAPAVTYAGRLGRSPGQEDTAIRQFTGTGGENLFLTAMEQYFPVPSRISGDHELLPTASDTAYQRVEYEDELLRVGGVPAWLLAVLATLTILVAVVVAGARLRRRRLRGATP